MGMIAQTIVNSLIAGSVYSLIAFGFTLIYGAMNFFNMAYGINVLVGAYSFYVAYRLLMLPLLASALFAVLVTAVLMLVIDRLCYYGFRQKRVPRWTNVVVSMAVATLFQAFITIAFGSSKHIVYYGFPKSIHILGIHITTVQIAILACTLVLVVGMSLYLRKTKTGKLIRAISNNKEMAKIVGIDVERVYIAIIIIGSFLATIAGIMIALNSDVQPMINGSSLLKAIIASIIGGVGNVTGAMVAGMLIGFIENFTVLFIGSGWKVAIPLVLIVVMMLMKPSTFGIEEKQ